MQDFPHHYPVSAQARSDANVELTSPGLDALESAPPVEFGGPGNRWSPESLLVAAVADCFILTFKAVARASKFDWHSLTCDVVGDLDRIERQIQFTGFHIKATLEIPEGLCQEKAEKLLQMAEKSCLITNSLKADSHLETEVRIAGLAA